MSAPVPPWQAFALGSAFFAGLTAVLGKRGVEGIPTSLATLLRTLVILALLAAVVAWRGAWRRLDALPPHGMTFLVLSGLATGLSWLCYYRALQLAPASRVAPVDKLGVVFAVMLGVVVLREALTWQVAAGTALIATGAILIARVG